MQNVLAEGRLKPSSNDAMVNSLTDGSTETFWESRDEPRSKTKSLMVTFNNDKKLYAAAIHNDNGKDSGVYIIVFAVHSNKRLLYGGILWWRW